MKRTVSMLIVLVILVTLIPISTFAEGGETAYDVIVAGMLSLESEVNIKSFNLTEDELGTMMQHIYENEPLLFYWDGYYSWSYSYSGKVTTVYFEYPYSNEEILSQKQFVEQKLAAIIASIPEGLDEYETAVYLHDYICVNFKYDTDYEIRDIYTMLKNGEAVCMGYAYLYGELLKRIGIESRTVISPQTSLNHMWNEILLDDVWYHVDATWDDPIPDGLGRTLHSNLFLSDDMLVATHKQEDVECVFEAEYSCTDERFKGMQWCLSKSSFGFINGEVYGVNSNRIYKFDLQSGEAEEMYLVDTEMWRFSDGYYYGYFIGLGEYNDLLYFNTQTEIKSFNVKTKEVRSVYTIGADEGMITGMYINGKTVNYFTSTTGFDKDGTAKSFDLPDTVEEPDDTPTDTPDVTPPEDDTLPTGDIDGDKDLDQYDVILVKRVYFHAIVMTDTLTTRSDVNHNGEVDVYDYLLVKRAYFNTYTFE